MSAPLIPPSTESNYVISQKLKADIILAETSITDGIATLSGGTLTNLLSAVDPQGVARKSQVSALAFPGGVADSIQYRNDGFAGTNNFTFSGGTTLTVNGGTIEDQTGMALNPSGIISNVVDPVNDNDLANKRYVDNLTTTSSITYILADTNQTLSAASMNGVIFRSSTGNSVSNASVTDTTATAAQIIASFPGTPEVNSTFRFMMINDNPERLNTSSSPSADDDYFEVTIQGGLNVTLEPSGSFVIPRGYTFDSLVIFDNVTSGSEAVTIRILNIDWFPKTFYFKPLNTTTYFLNAGLNIGNTGVFTGVYHVLSGNLFKSIDVTSVNTSNDIIYLNEVSKGLSIRSPTGISADTISNNILTKLVRSQIFTIVNQSAFNINLTPQDTMSVYTPATITVQAGHTATIGIKITDLNDLIGISGINFGSNYTAGSPITISGGSGSGMTATLPTTLTAALQIAAGTGYTTGTYTTSNVVGSGTGLTIEVGSVGGGGEVSTTIQYYDQAELTTNGYQTGDIVQLVGGNNDAQFLVIVGGMFGVNITNFGTGYANGDILTVQQVGSGNDAQLEISATNKYFTAEVFTHEPI